MSIPGDLSQKNRPAGGSTDSPRYFYFEDTSQTLIISGWCESSRSFQGIARFWKDQTQMWKGKGLPDPQDVLFHKIGNWEAIRYDLKNPRYTNSHIRAHWLQAGTWIDIHLSVKGSDRASAESRKFLGSVLGAISVKERT